MLYLTSPIEQETVKDIFGPLYRTGGIVTQYILEYKNIGNE